LVYKVGITFMGIIKDKEEEKLYFSLQWVIAINPEDY
jgi:hypothetical protein